MKEVDYDIFRKAYWELENKVKEIAKNAHHGISIECDADPDGNPNIEIEINWAGSRDSVDEAKDFTSALIDVIELVDKFKYSTGYKVAYL